MTFPRRQEPGKRHRSRIREAPPTPPSATRTTWWTSERGGERVEVEVFRDGKWEPADNLQPGVQYTIRVRRRTNYRLATKGIEVTLT
jgi:hypothetical protein